MRGILVEDRAEAEILSDQMRRRPEVSAGAVVVAIGVDAQVALQSAGIVHTTTLPFISTDSHQRISEHAEDVRARLQSWDLNDPDLPIDTYADTVRYYLRQYVCHFAWLLEIIARVCATAGLQTVSACVGAVEPGAAAPIGDRERYLGVLARAYTVAHGLAFVALPAPVEPMAAGQDGAGAWVVRPARRLKEVLLAVDRRPKVLVASPDYGMDGLIRELTARLPGVTWVTFTEGDMPAGREVLAQLAAEVVDRSRRRRVAIPLRSIPPLAARPAQIFRRAARSALAGAMAAIRPACVYAGVDYAHLLEQKIFRSLEPTCMALKASASYFDRLISDWDVKVVVGQFGTRDQHALLAVARARGREALMIPHGAVSFPEAPAARVEGRELRLVPDAATAIVAQSPSTLDYLAGMGSAPRVIATGRTLWPRTPRERRARIREALDLPPDAFVILHASTQKRRKVHRFFTHETADEYVADVADLVAVAGSLGTDTYLVVKLHPSGMPARDDLQRVLGSPQRVRLEPAGAFTDLLAAADVLVSYASTTAHEALYARIPVVLYDPWGRYQHLPGPAVTAAGTATRAAVYYVPSRDGLAAALRWVRTAHPTGRPLTDDELRPYVFVEGPPAAEQIAQFFQDVLVAERAGPAHMHQAGHPQ